ncbi:MAG: prepilin-type N-terminal cleavage/methylation domain-containing protein [Candidatus Aerophobetes bacterium]
MKISINQRFGFTFLEVIVVVAVLSLGLLSLVQILPLGLKAQNRAEELTVAYLLGEEKMEETKMRGYLALMEDYASTGEGPGEGEGEFENYQGYNWHLNWWDTDVPGLAKVQVRVLFGESGTSESRVNGESRKAGEHIELVTYLASRNSGQILREE